MDLVGVKDNHITGLTGTGRAAIVEGLNALHGDAQRIGIVAMGGKHITKEKGFHSLDPRQRGRRNEVLARFAQTFKTVRWGLVYRIQHYGFSPQPPEPENQRMRKCLIPKLPLFFAMISKIGNR
jgi:hypothetical protein